MAEFELAIKEIPSNTLQSSSEFENGPKIDPLKHVAGYDSDEWEAFIDEWVHSLKDVYSEVVRPTGPGDKGIDVAGFKDANRLAGAWDNYQCKHYARPLSFANVAPEIGKILWYSFGGKYAAPTTCRFIAPKGASPTLTLLLGNAVNLAAKVIAEWEKSISAKITSTQTVELEGKFRKYVEAFDFRIFSAPSSRWVIEQHRSTQYFPGRFGGGLPARPKPDLPPDEIEDHEKNYIDRLLEAYAEHKDCSEVSLHDLTKWTPLQAHFKRSRESFFHAESLGVFVRDKTEPGTFESLQDEIHGGVADIHEGQHNDGYARVLAVTDRAQSLALDAHPLNKAAHLADRRGVCHQLANEGRLVWKK